MLTLITTIKESETILTFAQIHIDKNEKPKLDKYAVNWIQIFLEIAPSLLISLVFMHQFVMSLWKERMFCQILFNVFYNIKANWLKDKSTCKRFYVFFDFLIAVLVTLWVFSESLIQEVMKWRDYFEKDTSHSFSGLKFISTEMIRK